MFIIVGLGNPTKEYEGTRHNVGFDVIDAIADKYNISVTERKNRAFCGKGIIEGQKVILAKPQTYMNLSGESVRGLIDFYKVFIEHFFYLIKTKLQLQFFLCQCKNFIIFTYKTIHIKQFQFTCFVFFVPYQFKIIFLHNAFYFIDKCVSFMGKNKKKRKSSQ